VQYRRLGRSGIQVSEVGLGGWLTQGRTLDDASTTAIVRRAFELGVNFFDTADVYHGGEAERALAVAVKGLRREDLVLATKCFFPMSDAPNDRGNGRKHLMESVHASLERLKTDYIDLMQFHRFDPETPVEETVRAVDDLVRQGKVLYWGTSMWPAWAIVDACHLARAMGSTPPVSNQPNYSMLERSIERSVLPASVRFGLGQVVFSPLAQGVLTGKYLPGQAPAEGTRGADGSSNMFMGGVLQDVVLERVQRLKPIAERNGLTQFALAWCLRQPGVSSVIVGASKVSQIEENVGASGALVPASDFEEAEGVLAP
jgi:aryl-alcohol dehydrogenase-like predicted oxidoreductase